jgi:pimeloyl-ACP methyl ester carboxylesterase
MIMTRHRILSALLVVSTLIHGSTATAQDRPVVFVHGFLGDSGTWAEAAARLQTRLAIQAYNPGLPSIETFETQASAIQNQGGYLLPLNTIAVGHSNGGIVSREWSKSHPLAGILTLGTPHEGALFMQRGTDAARFNYDLYNALGLLWSYEVSQNEFTWIFGVISAARAAAAAVNRATLWTLLSTAGIGYAAPVAGQMVPPSGYLATLNSGGNLVRELVTIPHRVGLVFVANDYRRAGFAVGLFPDQREWAYAGMVSAVLAFEWAGNYIVQHYPPWNAAAQSVARELFRAAAWIRELDPLWCWVITADRTCNTSHDGIVATDAQFYPGARNYGFIGPAHKQEAKWSDDLIAGVLTNIMGVRVRASSEVPPPPSGGNPTGPGTMTAGQRLYADQQIASPNGRFVLRYQSDGNLVLYDTWIGPRWASGTAGLPAGWAEMQVDGNLVIYGGGAALWASGTDGNPGAYLQVHDNGEVAIHDGQTGIGLWWTATGGV